MAFTSAFFDAELVGGEYDRVYSAEKFAEYFASFIANGVFPDPSTNLQVVANTVNDMNVLVSPGMGWINGYYCKNDGSYPLAVQAASGTLNRIDAVVIGWSRTNREITTYIKTGTASSSPTAPSLTRNADLYELMLATIMVNAGVTKVTQSMIVDKRADTSVCGWVAGVVQQIDTTNLFAQYDNAFQTWFADIQAQLSGDVATNLQRQITELSKSKLGKGDMATDEEVHEGTNTTHWTNPKQVAISAQTVQDVGTGNLVRTKLVVSHFGGSTIEIPFSLTDGLEGYTFRGVGVYNGLIHLFGTYNSRTSTSGSWTYYACCIIVDPVSKRVVWKNTNLVNSSLPKERVSYIRPTFNSHMRVISSDGSVVAILYRGSSYLMFDMKNRTCHYGIDTSYECGFFATDTFVGYFYANSTSNTRIYYKSRSSSGNSYSNKALGLSLYSGYGSTYFSPIGVTGNSILFYYRTSSTVYTLGKYDISTDTLQTGFGTVNSTNLYGQSALITMDNKVFIFGITSSGRGLFMVDPSNLTVTANIYPEAVLGSSRFYLDEKFTGFYFGTYKNLMYFVLPQIYSGNIQVNETVRVMAINRNTGELDSYYDVPFQEAVVRYYSSNQEQDINFAWFEKKLDEALGNNGYSSLDISQGSYQVIKSGQYLYYYDSTLKQSPMLSDGVWGILGECSQVNFLCVSGASASVDKLTIGVINKKPIYQMAPA